jgi:hypothetical protein
MSSLVIRQVALDKIVDKLKVCHLWNIQILVYHLLNAQIALEVTHRYPLSISRPPQSRQSSFLCVIFISSTLNLVLECLFVHNRTLHVVVDVPNIEEAVSINLSKDSWMHRRPLHVIHVLLTALKGGKGSLNDFIPRVPKFNTPVHGSREH